MACLATLLCVALPCAAQAGELVKLSATLTPERLGYGTTVGFGFKIVGRGGKVPPPLVGVEIRYPGNLGFALSGLGLSICEPTVLQAAGPKGCPSTSRMGFGSASAQLAVERLVVHEAAEVAIVRGPTKAGHLALLFYVAAEEPVSAQIVLPGLLVPAPAPFGGAVSLGVPLIPSWPEGPYVSIVTLRATLGPEHLTYYEHVKGKTVPFNPQGVLLPKVCPRGGFRFAGTFEFLDGSSAVADAVVPCPSPATRDRATPVGDDKGDAATDQPRANSSRDEVF